MSNPQVSVSKQLRRIERRRRQEAARRIAAMTLSQQMAFACALWRVERQIARVRG